MSRNFIHPGRIRILNDLSVPEPHLSIQLSYSLQILLAFIASPSPLISHSPSESRSSKRYSPCLNPKAEDNRMVRRRSQTRGAIRPQTISQTSGQIRDQEYHLHLATRVPTTSMMITSLKCTTPSRHPVSPTSLQVKASSEPCPEK